MDAIDYDHRDFNAQSADADKALAVRFFTSPIEDSEETAKQGRPIFKDTIMVEIRVRGARNEVVHKPVDDLIKRRFRDAWRAFEQGNEVMETGTPLAQWPMMSRSQVEEMKYFGFLTVEHLADARDDLLSKFPGLTGLKQRAKSFLELAKGGAPLERLQTQLEKEQSNSAALQQQVKELAERMAQMEKAKKD